MKDSGFKVPVRTTVLGDGESGAERPAMTGTYRESGPR